MQITGHTMVASLWQPVIQWKKWTGLWVVQHLGRSGCGQVKEHRLQTPTCLSLTLSASSRSTAAFSPRALFPRSISSKWAEYLIRLTRESDKTKWCGTKHGYAKHNPVILECAIFSSFLRFSPPPPPLPPKVQHWPSLKLKTSWIQFPLNLSL